MNAELKTLCKFYKGEENCPYSDNQADQRMFWFYEQRFERLFFGSPSFQGKDIKVAFAEYLDNLFPVLSDKFDAMDDGTWFRELYERLDT